MRAACSLPPIILGGGLAFGGIVDTSLEPWLRVGAVVLSLIVVAIGVRSWQLAVVMTQDGATVINLLRTRHFQWSEIERFVFHDGVSVRLRGGKELPVSAFAVTPEALPFVHRRSAAAWKVMESRRRAARQRR